MKWIGSIGLTAALGLAATTPTYAQAPSEARIQELIAQATARVAQSGTPTTQSPASAAPTPNRPTVSLTLDDAVKLALDRNLDIAVQRLNPQIQDEAVARIRSVYYPSVTSQLGTQATTTPATTSLAGSGQAGAPITTGLTTYNGGIAQSVPWGGGSFNVALNNNKSTTTSLNSLYNPTYNTNWSGVYTQPLLRNFGIDATRQSIQVTKLNRDISDVQLRATMTNTVSNVREAYWNYVYSVQAVAVAQQSVDLAEQLVKDNQTRVEVGTMAPIDVVTAQSQAAAARQNLVLAQGTMNTNELALKRLIVSGTEDTNWAAHLDPVDRPEFAAQPVDVEAAVRRALSERTDLLIANKVGQENTVTLKYLKDQLKPQADFVGTYGLVGAFGPQLILDPNTTGVNRPAIGSIPGGYSDALSQLFNGKFPRWTAQINLSYPLGTSFQQASVARARIQLSQTQAQVKQIELQVATDVTNAAITVQSNAERVQAAQAARELAEQTMRAEQSKFEVGMSTNYNVILTQRDLATAQINELQAILNYRIALVELERLQQTTLQTANVTVLTPQ
ncbi:MAG TPA: TolC family protein [Vicinamibacterales bacterium]|nr:TolC family protein [Vicinamibacterales bacterium]